MDDKFYSVEILLDKRLNPNAKTGRVETEYLVKWKDFSESDATWVPYRELKINCKELLKEYNDRQRKGSGKVGVIKQESAVEKSVGFTSFTPQFVEQFPAYEPPSIIDAVAHSPNRESRKKVKVEKPPCVYELPATEFCPGKQQQGFEVPEPEDLFRRSPTPQTMATHYQLLHVDYDGRTWQEQQQRPLQTKEVQDYRIEKTADDVLIVFFYDDGSYSSASLQKRLAAFPDKDFAFLLRHLLDTTR